MKTNVYILIMSGFIIQAAIAQGSVSTQKDAKDSLRLWFNNKDVGFLNPTRDGGYSLRLHESSRKELAAQLINNGLSGLVEEPDVYPHKKSKGKYLNQIENIILRDCSDITTCFENFFDIQLDEASCRKIVNDVKWLEQNDAQRDNPVMQRQERNNSVMQRQERANQIIQRRSEYRADQAWQLRWQQRANQIMQQQQPVNPVVQWQQPVNPVVQWQQPVNRVVQWQQPVNPVVQSLQSYVRPAAMQPPAPQPSRLSAQLMQQQQPANQPAILLDFDNNNPDNTPLPPAIIQALTRLQQ